MANLESASSAARRIADELVARIHAQLKVREGHAEYDRRKDGSDWWQLTAVGVPSQQRHESGKGFKPIQAALFDFNALHWLDEPLGFVAKWVPDPSAVAIGDVIFIYTDDDTSSFGYLYRVTDIGKERPAFTVELASPIRFVGSSEDIELIGEVPSGFSRRESCPHMGSATSNEARVSVWCPACVEAAAV